MRALNMDSTLANSLESNHMCIIDNFLEYKLAETLAKQITEFHRTHKSEFQQQRNFRSDQTCWLSHHENFSISCLNKSFSHIISNLVERYKTSDSLLQIRHKSKIQLSCFPAGCHGYKPHYDNPNDNGRLLTFVFYLNRNYKPEHGGMSQFLVKNRSELINVEPIFNRLVIYWSDKRVITQTLPVAKHLFSLTGWYFGEHEMN